jgi:hypothetical protein
MIDILYERIKMIYVNMMTQLFITHEIEVMFKSELNRSFNLRELRAVGVKYIHSFATRTKQEFVNMLWRYFSTRIHLPDQQFLSTDNFSRLMQADDEWIEARRLPVIPDPVPDFARDLVDTPSEDEQDIMWYIDRTPSGLIIGPNIMRNEELRLPEFDIRQLTGGHRIFGRDLLPEFDAVAHIPDVKKYKISPLLVEQQEKECVEECSICYENISSIDMVKLNCSHNFCGGCIKETLKAHNNIYCGPTCALCRAPMKSFSVKNPEIYNLVSEHCL